MSYVPSHDDSGLPAADSIDQDLERFELHWQEQGPPDLRTFLDASGTTGEQRRGFILELIKIDLESRWHRWGRTTLVTGDAASLPRCPLLERYGRLVPEIGPTSSFPLDLVEEEYRVRLRWGDRPRAADYLHRFPHLAEEWMEAAARIEEECHEEDVVGDLSMISLASGSRMRLAGVARVSGSVPPLSERDSASSFEDADALPPTPSDAGSGRRTLPTLPLPPSIGRYRVEGLLGQGGFGRVFLAIDGELGRRVAIKVPHRRSDAQRDHAAAYAAEARALARLDHPGIVPVHDIGRTEAGDYFVVSKYIEGQDLATRIRADRLPLIDAVEITAAVADALEHAHERGIVHRDIKPANILLDRGGRPYVVDFGSALRDEDFGRGAAFAGTPAYMSPEQARGEGHRVDGRSDVFSLGVVLYELLTGRRPFRGRTYSEVLEQIASQEVRPPRQVEESVPRELERVCLKALAKRACDRYESAREFAADLRHFLLQPPEAERTAPAFDAVALPDQPAPPTPAEMTPVGTTPPRSAGSTSGSWQQNLRIVPKGLRAFDAADADFFIELLPGVRDRRGLPESIRFWKQRIEAGDGEETFNVGLIYGPSGCGKSSLVKAGLLPRLDPRTATVYLEASGADTADRLCGLLHRRFADLPEPAGLAETLAALRRGRGLPRGGKLLIVLDQFEQWLHHVRGEEAFRRLADALRQCDGRRVQCLLLVRDDFWMAATRFLQQVEVPIVEGRNAAAVDLFDMAHARRLLVAFGRALGALPDHSGRLRRDQETFIERAVAGLSQEGKVIPARLALFAEMVKGKPWTPATLAAVGGARGIGFMFLEETFDAPTAVPERRLHQVAARAVLKALLPEQGTNIKGHRRTREELLAVSGYADRPEQFSQLIRILDAEVRLVTPADQEGQGDAPPQTYQLTHDYLVASLRDWLTRKQQQTLRGRTELLLQDRAALWNAHPEDRYLPSRREWVRILLLTRRADWSAAQAEMMARAERFHAGRGMLWLATVGTLITLAIVAWHQTYRESERKQAEAIVARLGVAETSQVPEILKDLKAYRVLAEPELRRVLAESDPASPASLHAALALLPHDPTLAHRLYARLLVSPPAEFRVIRNALRDQVLTVQGLPLVERLWRDLQERRTPSGQRLHAAAALATYAPTDSRWATVAGDVADRLVDQNTLVLEPWMDALTPVRGHLLEPLAAHFRDDDPDHLTHRRNATEILFVYASDHPRLLAELAADADPFQFDALFPQLQRQGQPAVDQLAQTLTRFSSETTPPADPTAITGARANAALALFRLGQTEQFWQLLRPQTDPSLRNLIIHRYAALGGEIDALRERLNIETDAGIRRALLILLGEIGPKQLTGADRNALLTQLEELLAGDSDPGVHGAAEWALRRFGAEDRIAKVQNSQPRAQFWYVNSVGQTFVILNGPVTFEQGSPETEAGRTADETHHRVKISHHFALAAKEVTVAEFQRFLAAYPQISHGYPEAHAPERGCPQIKVNWYQAIAFCRWLSEQEGIPEEQMCYPPLDKFDGTLPADFLTRCGYRLPTEAEWEYACRGETLTAWSFGAIEDLISEYAWHVGNAGDRTWPVGQLKPNDFGLFDMHGNAFEWCHDVVGPYPAAGEEPLIDVGGSPAGMMSADRVVRGGTMFLLPRYLRSAARNGLHPQFPSPSVGFRVARTIP